MLHEGLRKGLGERRTNCRHQFRPAFAGSRRKVGGRFVVVLVPGLGAARARPEFVPPEDTPIKHEAARFCPLANGFFTEACNDGPAISCRPHGAAYLS